VDSNNNILVADQDNHRIQMIAGKSGSVMTMVGSAEKRKVNSTDVQFALASPIR